MHPLNPVECQEYLAFARGLIKTTRKIIKKRVVQGFAIDLKPDASFVTQADKEIEIALRKAIGKRFPTHGIIGEEFPHTHPTSDFQWILDPIDGTENFALGTPTFGTIIALHYRGQPMVGITDHPLLNLCYSAARGIGAFCNDDKIHVDDHARVAGGLEVVVTTAPENFMKSGDLPVLQAIERVCPNTRIYRDCFGHTRVYQGSAGAQVDFNVRLWDIAAIQILIEEAGGTYVCLREFQRSAEDIMYSVVFGKPRVVERLLPMIKQVMTAV